MEKNKYISCYDCNQIKALSTRIHSLESIVKALKKENLELKSLTQKYQHTNAHFSILTEVAKYINSSMSSKDLLNIINDILIGLMGVSLSCISLKEKTPTEYSSYITSVFGEEYRIWFEKNFRKSEIIQWLNKGSFILKNEIHNEHYSFIRNNKINSFIAVPFQRNEIKGLIIVGHTIANYFTANSVHLIEAVAEQISIAVENSFLYSKMQDLATKDPLTGVYNRLFLSRKLEELFSQSNEKDFCLAIFDIDHFKNFNDTYGHLGGDITLKSVCNLASKFASENNGTVFRYGGEEFVILLENKQKEEFIEKIESFRQKLEKTKVILDGKVAYVTASFGLISTYTCKDKTKFLNFADHALYQSKNEGRNRSTYYEGKK